MDIKEKFQFPVGINHRSDQELELPACFEIKFQFPVGINHRSDEPTPIATSDWVDGFQFPVGINHRSDELCVVGHSQ